VPRAAKAEEMTRLSPARRAKLLERVAAFYHQRFLDRLEGQQYLVKVRGIRNGSLFGDYRIGYADGSLLQALPQDAESIDLFRQLGVLNGRNREVLAGCVVFPLFDAAGALVSLYGCRIEDGPAQHVYLAEDVCGIWNAQAARRSSRLLLTGSILDALTLVDRGMADVLPCIGQAGLNADQVALLGQCAVKGVTLCLPGGESSEEVEGQLAALNISVQIASLPAGEDLNSYLSRHEIGAFQTLLPKNEPVKLASSVDCRHTAQGLILHPGARRYEVKAFARQGTQLKATIKASGDTAQGFELHTLDLYSARSRETYAQACAKLFGEEVAQIKADLERLLEQVEAWTPQDSDSEPTRVILTARERESGLELLRDPKLLERIERDLTTLGIAGEGLNKRLCYLAAVSRKLEDPLSLLIQSRSAAGKSTLQNAVLSLVPDEDKVVYTRLTDQALFYQNPTALTHKLLALEEAEGLGGAAYSLRALQSSKQLAIATTAKDAVTGKMKTEQYWVQGPVAVLLTTTSAALDEETASRFLTVSIDESADMTERIFERQREADTLAGYLRQLEHRAVVRQHQAAQRLLEPLAVINPYAPQLHFPAHSLRARRDHKKYLMLIKAIAFLHQQQRPVKEHLHGDQVLRYIEATREDIRAANIIAESVLTQSASELSAPARTLLTYIHAHVQKHCAGQNLAPREYTFTRKTVRDSIGWSDWQVRTHIRELEELEYLKARSGAWGKEYLYELLGDGTDAGASGLTLTDPDELREPAT
jgi:DNA primase